MRRKVEAWLVETEAFATALRGPKNWARSKALKYADGEKVKLTALVRRDRKAEAVLRSVLTDKAITDSFLCENRRCRSKACRAIRAYRATKKRKAKQ